MSAVIATAIEKAITKETKRIITNDKRQQNNND